MTRRFTGRHMAALLVGFFAIVIAVNIMMAIVARRSFGGTVVDNSYVASQHFNRWLDAADRQRAAGIVLRAGRRDGHVVITLDRGGQPVDGGTLAVVARHPLGVLPERTLRFAPLGGGRYRSIEPLPRGRWRLHVDLRTPAGVARFIEELQS